MVFRSQVLAGLLGHAARNRFNNLTLVFGNQTSYLAPPFPFLVEVPEHPEVKAIGLSKEERRRNLDMLRAISDMARDHGLDFTLGLWTERPLLGPSMVEGIARGDDKQKNSPLPTDYCARRSNACCANVLPSLAFSSA